MTYLVGSAPYPATSASEIKSVTTLMHILDRTQIIPETKFLDKIPNTDGIIDVTDKNRVSIGKFEVQIKTLDKKNLEKPKHQCEKTFLAFAEDSILPVLLIVVDAKNEKAYWEYFGHSLLLELSLQIKGASISVPLEKGKVIEKNNNGYIDAWIQIIKKA